MQASSEPLGPPGQAHWQRAIYGVSAALCVAVAFLILGPRPEGMAGAVDVSGLPAWNASVNAITTVLLLSGFAAIKTGRRTLHKRLMLSAFGTSTVFLLSYVTYHWFSAGPALYEGSFRAFYLFVLLTHIVLAAVILPLALTTLARGLLDQLPAHRKIAPITLAVWLYVSVTGVLIFWMVHA